MSSSMYFPDKPFQLATAIQAVDLLTTAYEQYKQWKEQGDPRPSRFHWKPSVQEYNYRGPIWARSRFLWRDRFEPFGFMCSKGRTVFIVIRGTESGANWVTNLDADLKAYRIVAGYGKTHDGFTKLYRRMRSQLIKLLDSYPAVQKIVVVGHSLGAAISTLAIPDILAHSSVAQRLRNKIEHYNFASPRLASQKFAQKYQSLGVTTYRVVNTSDIVPCLPLPITGRWIYQHIGQQISFTAQYGDTSANHSVRGAYRYALENPLAPMKQT